VLGLRADVLSHLPIERGKKIELTLSYPSVLPYIDFSAHLQAFES